MQRHFAPPGALRFQRFGHALLFLLLACAAIAQQSISQPSISQPSSLIQPGDILNISVTQDASFNGRYQVGSGGDIVIPAEGVGSIYIAGDTLPAAKAAVELALERTQLEYATVTIEKFAHSADVVDVVYLTGRGGHTFAFPFKSGDNLGAVAAILRSGGVSRLADLHDNDTCILRDSPGGTRIAIPVNIKAIMNKKAPDIPLQKNDCVLVSDWPPIEPNPRMPLRHWPSIEPDSSMPLWRLKSPPAPPILFASPDVSAIPVTAFQIAR